MLVKHLRYFLKLVLIVCKKSVIGGQSKERPKRLSSWCYWPSRIRS